MGSRFVARFFGVSRFSAARWSAGALVVVSGASLAALGTACSDGFGGLSGGGGIISPGGPAEPSSTIGPRPEFGETVTLASAPPAITGGTLLITKTGVAVASDPDRDQIYVVDLASRSLTATLALNAGDEPGRLAEDDQGNVHVALRRGGALVTVNVANAQIVGRRSVCSAPRGVTFDGTTGNLYVACNGGELVTLPAEGGAATRTLQLGPDLRDVVVQQGSLFVTRLRSAEVIQIDANGVVQGLGTPPVSGTGMEPDIAWRLIPVPVGGGAGSDSVAMAMVHQRAQPDPVSVQTGGYAQSSGGTNCLSSIVESTISIFWGTDSDTNNPGPIIPAAVLPVDLAASSDGQTFAVVAAGNGHTPELPGVYFLARQSGNGELFGSNGCADNLASGPVPGQATAVALTSHNEGWVQTREPAGLFRVVAQPDGSVKVTDTIQLSTVSREDTGQTIAHSNSGGFVACASCHAEGGDDGRVWRFAEGAGATPARRTQALRGTLEGTAPYHWEGDMTDISMLAHEVFVKRMDGQELTPDQAAALQAWLFTVPAPNLSPPVDTAAVARGSALFHSADVGCSTCHSGAKFTNNLTLDVGTGGMFQVPSLIGVSWGGPHRHPGGAPAPPDRFNPGLAGALHGHTSQLTTPQIDDLISFLQTL
jgi:cytochrome c553